MTILTEQAIIALRQRTLAARTLVIIEPVVVDLDDTADAAAAAQLQAAAEYEAGRQQAGEAANAHNAAYGQDYDPREGPDAGM